MVNGMGNRIHDFPADRGTGKLGALSRIARFARHIQLAGQASDAERLETCADFAGCIQGREAVRFDKRSTFTVVVIQVTGRRGVEQAAEVIEAVAIVSTDAGVECSGELLNVLIVFDLAQQVFTLIEDLDH